MSELRKHGFTVLVVVSAAWVFPLWGCGTSGHPDTERRTYIDPLLTLSREYHKTRYTPVYWYQYLTPFSEEGQGPVVKVIEQGLPIVPLLIEHLDDRRETGLIFFFNPHYPYERLEQPLRVKVGVIALYCLERIIGGVPREQGMEFGMIPSPEEMAVVRAKWEAWWEKNHHDLEQAEISQWGE